MLYIVMPERELFDEVTNTFSYTKKETLQLEHSLVSLSKWESKWCKPFLSKEKKTDEETIDYIRCMMITQNVDPLFYDNIPQSVFNEIDEYIQSKMTATWFNEDPSAPKNRDVITAEIIYYWMITLQIPMECQKWHLNRLLTLIRVCNIKSQPPKKQGRKEAMSKRAALNQARRARHSTKG